MEANRLEIERVAELIFNVMCATFTEHKWMICGPWSKASHLWRDACIKSAREVLTATPNTATT